LGGVGWTAGRNQGRGSRRGRTRDLGPVRAGPWSDGPSSSLRLTARRTLETGALDEIQIHQIQILLGSGRRLLGELDSSIELDVVRVIDTPEAMPIRDRVRR